MAGEILNICPSCGLEVDVSGEGIFSKIECLGCGNFFRVRSVVGNFTIKKQIGHGGMSYVFEAWDDMLERAVALKVMNFGESASDSLLKLFKKEAQITASLNHPNIVKIFMVGEEESFFYIAMELLRGDSLEKIIEEGFTLSDEGVVKIFLPIVDSLNYAYKTGLIHRDIKPGNILITDFQKPKSGNLDTENAMPKIVDFGLAVMEGQSDELEDMWATPFHVPPEKLKGEQEDVRSDIYSLGSTIFQSMTGKPPYDCNTNSIEELLGIKQKPINFTKELSNANPQLVKILENMLAVEPEIRFPDYTELLHEFNILSKALAAEKAKLNTKKKLKQTKSQLKTIIAIATAALLIALPVLAYFWYAKNNKTSEENYHTDIIKEEAVFTGTSTSITKKFNQARQLLTEGKTEEARIKFANLSSEISRLNPKNKLNITENWVNFNCAIANYILNKRNDAINYLSKIKPIPDQDTESQKLSQFFQNLKDISPENPNNDYEFLHSFASALDIWHSGNISLATEKFKKFAEHKFSQKHNWMTAYKKISSRYLADAEIITQATKPLNTQIWQNEKSLQDAQQALAEHKANTEELSTSGIGLQIMAQRLEEIEDIISYHEDLLAQKKAKEDEEIYKKEIREYRRLIRSLKTYGNPFEPEKAISFLRKAEFNSEKIKSMIVDEIYFWQAGKSYIDLIISELKSGDVSFLSLKLLGFTPGKDANFKSGKIEIIDGKKIIVQFSNQKNGKYELSLDKLQPNILVELGEKIINRKKRALFSQTSEDSEVNEQPSKAIETETSQISDALGQIRANMKTEAKFESNEMLSYYEPYLAYVFLALKSSERKNLNTYKAKARILTESSPQFCRIWRRKIAQIYLGIY